MIAPLDLPLPRPVDPPRKKYIFTVPGGLKLSIFIVGFLIANIGADGVFNSKFYLGYYAFQLSKSREFEENLWTSVNRSAACKQMELKRSQLKKEYAKLEKRKDKKSIVAARVVKGTLHKEMDMFEILCRVLHPPWIALEHYFVFAAITCVVLELASLGLGIFREDLAKKYKCLDGTIHAFLGILILAGSICLLVALHNRMDEGPEQLIHTATLRYDAAGKRLDVLQARYDKREVNTEAQKKELAADKVTIDKEQVYQKVHIRVFKRMVSYNEKITAATFGIINCVLHLFTAPIIARGDITFRLR